MNIHDRLSFFYKLLSTSYTISLWTYDADFHLTYSTADWNLLSFADFIPAIQYHLSNQMFRPLLLETNINMLWIIGFSHTENTLNGICLLGPILTGEDTSNLLLKKLETYTLSVQTHAIVKKMVTQTPILSTGSLITYALMLHYALNEETLPPSDVVFFTPEKEHETPIEVSNPHTGAWLKEQQLCQMFEEGNPEAISAIRSALFISSGVNSNIKDSLRKHKNNALVLLVLCSRSCIRGGLPASVAYDLNDSYTTSLENCKTLGEITTFCETMVADFMDHMHHIKSAPSISSSMKNVCYYIKKHLTEPLSIETLAKLTGYSEYYFSHKFQEELGISVKDFILNEKIEQAKTLLSDSQKSIQEISDELAFCNRNYFSTCFQKKLGMSPRQYRTKYR